MKKIYALVFGAVLALTSSMSVQAQCIDRYATEIFNNVYVVQDVIYGRSIAENGVDTTDLRMDIYRPVGDTATDRPVVIFAHGGSFVGGDENMGDMVAFCTAMAKRGYVAVSISYRLTSQASLINPDNMVKAVMRAVQDGKGAVRFLRRIESETDSLGIDGNNIFFGGTSAGGVLAYHLAYMNDTTSLPQDWRDFARDLGGLEGNSGSAGYSSWVKAVVGYAGAVADTNWVEADEVPFLAMHSENDNTVPYAEGFPLGIPTLPTLFGSAAMSVRADNIGLDNVFYSYTGGAHPPHAAGQTVVDSTILYTSRFLYSYLSCNPDSIQIGINDVDLINTLNVYPNPSTGIFYLESNDPAQVLVAEVFNAQGQVVRTVELENGRSTVNLTNEASGLYMLYVRDAVTGKSVSVNKLMLK